ncbi:MAG: transcription antitermination factor NusB [Halobacteriovoraceae bacterium]|nr:transcription antitermination factor NusB [Halobacteriovoraceae bacterium]|tara:strand:+ start:7403 stop:7855 length:453 start_codon:yes stop_codon:yes gene_type:complete
MSTQTKIREFCFQYLFHLQLPIFSEAKAELLSEDKSQIKNSLNDFKETTNSLFNDQENEKVLNRSYGVIQNYQELEDKISNNLKNWKINRLSKVDHTILLLASYELMYEKETPRNVVINEAIELSKKFGAQDSSRFINGVLDNLSKSLEN